MRHISDVERRRRLATRHALVAGAQAASPEAATRAMTVLHATEPASVHLACWARVPGLEVADVQRALYEDRSLVKQLAMRRTLWVLPRDLLAPTWGSASARVAATERARMAKDAVRAGLATDGDAWLDQARAEVLEVLREAPEGLPATQVRARVPMIDVKVSVSAGSVWGASRVLTHLGATADVVRATSTAHWRLSRYRWTRTEHWLDEVPEPWPAPEGYAELLRRWLRTFGPGTEEDVVWWFGATKGIARAALAAVGAVEVSLDGGGTGWVLPDDVDEPDSSDRTGRAEPWVALLPVLDPTVMGWKRREWYLGPHAAQLFDRNGNAGTTAWVDGRVVGCWTQDEGGVVAVRLLEEVPRGAARALEQRAAELTAWLDGTRIGTVYPSPAMKPAAVDPPVEADRGA